MKDKINIKEKEMKVYDEVNNLAQAIKESKEYLVFIKTKVSLQDEIYNVIRENHLNLQYLI